MWFGGYSYLIESERIIDSSKAPSDDDGMWGWVSRLKDAWYAHEVKISMVSDYRRGICEWRDILRQDGEFPWTPFETKQDAIKACVADSVLKRETFLNDKP
jgi:hypothetical protein